MTHQWRLAWLGLLVVVAHAVLAGTSASLEECRALLSTDPVTAYHRLRILRAQMPGNQKCAALFHEARSRAVTYYIVEGNKDIAAGELRRAREKFSSALAIDSSNQHAAAGLQDVKRAEAEATTLAIRARALAMRGLLDDARGVLNQALLKDRDSADVEQVREQLDTLTKLLNRYEHGLRTANWTAAYEALQMMKAAGISATWAAALQRPLDAKRQSSGMLDYIQQLMASGQYASALSVGALISAPDVLTAWAPLRDECERALLADVERLMDQKQWRAAWQRLKSLNISSERATQLKEVIAHVLAPEVKRNGLALVTKQQWQQAVAELSIAADLNPADPDVAEAVRQCREHLQSIYYQACHEALRCGKPGNALVYAAALMLLNSKDAAVSNLIETCLAAIRSQIAINVGIVDGRKTSFDAKLAPRLSEGVFRELWNRRLPGIHVFDEARWNMRMHSGLANTGMCLAVELTVFPIEVFTRECVQTEERRYQAGTIRLRNPEYDALCQRRDTLESYRHNLRQENRQHRAAFGHSFAGLIGAGVRVAELGGMGYAGAELARAALGEGVAGRAVEGIGGMIVASMNMSEVNNDLGEIERELMQIQKSLKNDVQPFVEDPVYKEFVDNRQYFFRTARSRCEIKLVALPEATVISARDVVKDILSSDRYVPGNKLAGVAPDPKDLPSEGEMKEAAMDELIMAVSDDIQASIGRIFLGYCGNACIAAAKKDHQTALEEACRFLASSAVRTEAASVPLMLDYFNEKVAALVPAHDPRTVTLATRIFGVGERKPITIIPEAVATGPRFFGMLIVHEETGADSDSAVMCGLISQLFKDRNRSVLVKSTAQLGAINDFGQTTAGRLAQYGKQTGRRAVISVGAETKSMGTSKIYDATFYKYTGTLTITAVDTQSGETIFEQSVSADATSFDDMLTKKDVMAKLLQQVRTGLLAAIEELDM